MGKKAAPMGAVEGGLEILANEKVLATRCLLSRA
jgi:hypothetical protein